MEQTHYIIELIYFRVKNRVNHWRLCKTIDNHDVKKKNILIINTKLQTVFVLGFEEDGVIHTDQYSVNKVRNLVT